MKKKGLLIILIGSVVLLLVLKFYPPSIPHSVESRKECVTCHDLNGVKPYPSWHATRGYRNTDCTTCHHPASGISK